MNTNLINQNELRKSVDPNRMTLAARALSFALPKPKFFIEKAVILFDEVHVTYIAENDLNACLPREDDWQEAAIKLHKLESFVAASFNLPNAYADYSLGMWVDENINGCVKAYLEAGKELVR